LKHKAEDLSNYPLALHLLPVAVAPGSPQLGKLLLPIQVLHGFPHPQQKWLFTILSLCFCISSFSIFCHVFSWFFLAYFQERGKNANVRTFYSKQSLIISDTYSSDQLDVSANSLSIIISSPLTKACAPITTILLTCSGFLKKKKNETHFSERQESACKDICGQAVRYLSTSIKFIFLFQIPMLKKILRFLSHSTYRYSTVYQCDPIISAIYGTKLFLLLTLMYFTNVMVLTEFNMLMNTPTLEGLPYLLSRLGMNVSIMFDNVTHVQKFTSS
jgi:hypothetical protein